MNKLFKFIPDFTNTIIKEIITFFLEATFLIIFFTLQNPLSGIRYKAQTPITLSKAPLYGNIKNSSVPLICHVSYYEALYFY